jgi:hypothetical protein
LKVFLEFEVHFLLQEELNLALIFRSEVHNELAESEACSNKGNKAMALDTITVAIDTYLFPSSGDCLFH